VNLCNNEEFCNYEQFSQLTNNIIGNMTFNEYLSICNSPLYVPPIIDDYFECYTWIFAIICFILGVAIIWQIWRLEKEKKKVEVERMQMQSLMTGYSNNF
jgi:hypothetical protein